MFDVFLNMKKLLLILLASGLFNALRSQDTHTGIVPSQHTFHPFLSLGPGFSYSVINNRKEVRGQFKPGINGHMMLYTSPWFAISGDYSSFIRHSALSFNDIRSWNAELNGNLFMNVGQTNLFFKVLFGVEYMDWRGTFVGPTLNDNNKYYYGLMVKENWIAGNFGCGVAGRLAPHLNAFGDFRMRFATEEQDLISISDTGFFIGIDYSFQQAAKPATHDSYKGKHKTTKNKSGRLYRWLKKGA